MTLRSAAPFAVMVALLLLPNSVSSASASAFVGGTTAWTLVAGPTVVPLGCCMTAEVNYQNNLNVTESGIVYVVLHNGDGQTVFFTGSTLGNIPPGGTLFAYLVMYGVAPGTYNATFFASSFGGVAISAPTANVKLAVSN